MNTDNDAWIDQIIFSWTERDRLGRSGIGPTATSMERQELMTWTDRLLPRLRMADAANPPPTSLFYNVYGDTAAVLYRVRKRPGTDRTERCHALIGPAVHLTGHLALLLSRWSLWESEEGTGPSYRHRLPVSELWAGERAAKAELSGYTGATPLVVSLVAESLCHLGEPLSVILTEPVDECRVLWCLFDIVGELLAAPAAPQPWTFSTWEDQHHAGVDDLPKIVFVPANTRANATYPVTRIVVSGQPRSDNPYADVAQALVGTYTNGGRQAVRQALTSYGVFRIASVEARLDRLVDHIGAPVPARSPQPWVDAPRSVPLRADPPRLDPPRPGPARPAPPHAVPTEPVPVPSRMPTVVLPPSAPPPSMPPIRNPASTEPPTRGPAPGNEPRYGEDGRDRGPAPTSIPWSSAPTASPYYPPSPDPLAALMGEREREAAARLLHQLVERALRSQPVERVSARELLTRINWVQHLAGIYRSESGETAWEDVRVGLRILLTYALGRDLGEPALDPQVRGELDAQLRKLITDRDTSPHMLVALAEYAVDRNAYDRLVGYYGIRWFHERGLDVPAVPGETVREWGVPAWWWRGWFARLKRPGIVLGAGMTAGILGTLVVVRLILGAVGH